MARQFLALDRSAKTGPRTHSFPPVTGSDELRHVVFLPDQPAAVPHDIANILAQHSSGWDVFEVVDGQPVPYRLEAVDNRANAPSKARMEEVPPGSVVATLQELHLDPLRQRYREMFPYTPNLGRISKGDLITALLSGVEFIDSEDADPTDTDT